MSDAVSFEGKLYSYRKGKDGLIVSFIVHPSDVPNELALADIGQRFGVALAQLRDDDSLGTVTVQRVPPAPPAEQAKPTKRTDEYRRDEAKARYALEGEPGRAIIRSAILCGDADFQSWIARKTHGIAVPQNIIEEARNQKDANEKVAAHRLRRHLGISSRSKIGSEEAAFAAFTRMETEYRIATGYMAEERG